MKCPACSHELTERDNGTVIVDACEGGCGGVWFDNFELKKVDEQTEEAGDVLLDIPSDPAVKVDHKIRRKCPACETITMRRFPFSARKQIEVDECAQCGGVWLDAGELGRIRSEFKTEDLRIEAAAEVFDAKFKGDMAAERQVSQEKVERAGKFAKMFKWICPSAYMPGKQDGAAF